MTPEQKAAFVFSQSVACLCEMEGMKALNEERRRHDKADAYDVDAFVSLPDKFGIGHNAVVELLRG